jgi:hypothetical protein
LLNSASRGTIAGTSGLKTNFGFTMKFNKTGGSPKGQCNIIVRSGGKIYQIKANAINTLSVGAKLLRVYQHTSIRKLITVILPIRCIQSQWEVILILP